MISPGYPKGYVICRERFLTRLIDRESFAPVSMSALEALHIYEEHPHLRSSPTSEFLHFVVVDSVLGPAYGIYPDTLFSSEPNYCSDDYEILDGLESYITDIDVVDSKGKIFQTRILIKQGWAESRIELFGQVYDRANNFEVMANINENASQGDKFFIAEPHVAASFSDHSHLEYLVVTDWEYDCQFTSILGLALALDVRCFSSSVASRQAKGLMRTTLRLLANPNSAANADSIVVRTLCAEDIPQQMIAEFLESPYLDLGGRSNKQLDCLLADLFPLIMVVRLHAAGNLKDAMLAFRWWRDIACKQDLGVNMLSYCKHDALENLLSYDKDSDNEELLNENIIGKYITFAKNKTLGLAENDIFWKWSQKHSRVAKRFQNYFEKTKHQHLLEKDNKALEKEEKLLENKKRGTPKLSVLLLPPGSYDAQITEVGKSSDESSMNDNHNTNDESEIDASRVFKRGKCS